MFPITFEKLLSVKCLNMGHDYYIKNYILRLRMELLYWTYIGLNKNDNRQLKKKLHVLKNEF